MDKNEIDEMDGHDRNELSSSKKSRHRKKQKYNEIRKQMEFYFGDSNLSKDRFLKQRIEDDPFVPLEIFLSFNKMKQLAASPKDIATALENSTILKLSEDKTRVCRTTEIKQKQDVDEYIIYVESLPPNVDHDWIQNTFSVFGPIAYVSLPRYKHTKKIKEFAFIEFENKSSVQKAISAFEEFRGVITLEKNPDELMSIVSYIREENATKGMEEPSCEKQSGDDDDDDDDEENEVEDQPPSKKIKFSEEALEPPQEMAPVEEEPHIETNLVDPALEENQVDSLIDEVDDNEDNNESMDGEGGEKKKRKRMRKKKAGIIAPVVAPDRNCSITDLRITTKLAWKRLRNKYLNLQREKFKQMKQNYRNENANRRTPQKPHQNSLKSTRNINFYGAMNEAEKKGNGETDEIKTKEAEIITKPPLFSYEPGIIVNVKFGEPCVDIKDFKAEMRQYSQVKYVDVKEGSCEAFIRLDAPISADSFIKQCSDPNYQFAVLAGDDEQSYWHKIKKDREDKLLKKVKIKTSEKFVDKVIKKSAVHIRFDDE